MTLKKTDTLTIRLDPVVKEVLRKAADEERRSITNMVEVMILRYAKGVPPQRKVLGLSTGRVASSKTGSHHKSR